jgi:protein TonB
MIPQLVVKKNVVKKKVVKQIGGALLIMVGGSVTVFGLMLLMNGFNQASETPEIERTKEFSVAPRVEPPKQKPKPKPKPRERRPMKSNAAPPPSLNSAIGSVSLNLPGVAPGEMAEVGEELLGDVQASVMTADSVDQKPKALRQVQPELPRRLVQKQIGGEVVAEALIGQDGRVERVRIKSATPPGLFEQIVQDALRQWQFQPATYKGEPVKMWATVPFDFELGR